MGLHEEKDSFRGLRRLLALSSIDQIDLIVGRLLPSSSSSPLLPLLLPSAPLLPSLLELFLPLLLSGSSFPLSRDWSFASQEKSSFRSEHRRSSSGSFIVNCRSRTAGFAALWCEQRHSQCSVGTTPMTEATYVHGTFPRTRLENYPMFMPGSAQAIGQELASNR